ncbi:MAG: hypothetical protein EXS30_11885 [Pedosphaera sp.]|nr:hypothetical protein [Pedosphaera sp.]
MDDLRFKPRPLEIPEDDPFKWDLLTRKDSAEILTAFVGSLAEPFVLAIDSPWGTGKTTFLRMWLQYMKNQGLPCLYYNAWENDFSESPLVSLIGELGSGIESLRLGGEQEKTAQKVFEKTKKVGAVLLKAALPTAVKLATAGLLDFSTATETDLSKLAEDFAKRQIEKYQTDKKTIRSFREKLTELVKAFAEKESVIHPKPLVFVVDELDRCRPTYAVELLEKIKHLFSVDGLVFVLAIDRQQLGKSVEALYGIGMDADGYLRRFIDLEYRLPEADQEEFAKAQFSRFGLDSLLNSKVGDSRYDTADIREALPKCFKLFRFSLRTQEQCFTQLLIILRTTPRGDLLFGLLLVMLLCLRSAKRELYQDYCSGNVNSDEVLKYLRSIRGGLQLLDSQLGTGFEAHLVMGIRDEKSRQSVITRYQTAAKNPETTKPAEAARAKIILDKVLSLRVQPYSDVIGYLYKKIEMAHHFIEPEASRSSFLSPLQSADM